MRTANSKHDRCGTQTAPAPFLPSHDKVGSAARCAISLIAEFAFAAKVRSAGPRRSMPKGGQRRVWAEGDAVSFAACAKMRSPAMGILGLFP